MPMTLEQLTETLFPRQRPHNAHPYFYRPTDFAANTAAQASSPSSTNPHIARAEQDQRTPSKTQRTPGHQRQGFPRPHGKNNNPWAYENRGAQPYQRPGHIAYGRLSPPYRTPNGLVYADTVTGQVRFADWATLRAWEALRALCAAQYNSANGLTVPFPAASYADFGPRDKDGAPQTRLWRPRCEGCGEMLSEEELYINWRAMRDRGASEERAHIGETKSDTACGGAAGSTKEKTMKTMKAKKRQEPTRCMRCRKYPNWLYIPATFVPPVLLGETPRQMDDAVEAELVAYARTHAQEILDECARGLGAEREWMPLYAAHVRLGEDGGEKNSSPEIDMWLRAQVWFGEEAMCAAAACEMLVKLMPSSFALPVLLTDASSGRAVVTILRYSVDDGLRPRYESGEDVRP